MTYLRSDLPSLLRDAGLTVVTVDGWRTRSRPASTGGFDPVGVLNHHTGASARGWDRAKELDYAKWMFLVGRPGAGLPPPLVQIALGRSGVVYVGAAGRANHAGRAKASGSVSAGDGNLLYVGVEWMLSGTEIIPTSMMKAGAILNAVLLEKVTNTSVRTVSCHYQTSVTGKWDIGDPDGVPFNGKRVLDIDKFRSAVKAQRDRLYNVTPVPAPAPEKPMKPSAADIVHLHTSGRYDRSPQSVVGDMKVWLNDGDVTLITATEFGNNVRRNVVRDMPGWDLYNGVEKAGADDCLVAWREDRWTLVESTSTVVSTKKSYRSNGSLIPPQRVTDVLLLDRLTGRTLYVSVSHLSSHVETEGGIRDSLRGKVWRDATRNWAAHQRQVRKQWRPSARMLVADWNVNWRRSWFRGYIHTILPGFRSGWRKPYPDKGTLGNRIIDITLFTWRYLSLVSKAEVLTRHRSSDHRAFRETLRWK